LFVCLFDFCLVWGLVGSGDGEMEYSILVFARRSWNILRGGFSLYPLFVWDFVVATTFENNTITKTIDGFYLLVEDLTSIECASQLFES